MVLTFRLNFLVVSNFTLQGSTKVHDERITVTLSTEIDLDLDDHVVPLSEKVEKYIMVFLVLLRKRMWTRVDVEFTHFEGCSSTRGRQKQTGRK